MLVFLVYIVLFLPYYYYYSYIPNKHTISFSARF
nr:MAG TPA: hypothetical protein [Caudoviricetes sp.]